MYQKSIGTLHFKNMQGNFWEYIWHFLKVMKYKDYEGIDNKFKSQGSNTY